MNEENDRYVDWAINAAIVAQIILLLAIRLLNYGGYLPVASGLTLNHLFLFCFFYVGLLLFGILAAAYRKRYGSLGIQLLLPICSIISFRLPSTFSQFP